MAKAKLQIRAGGGGDIVSVLARGERVVFTGADGSEIQIFVDGDGDLRLSCDEQLLILPASTNTVKIREQHGRGASLE